MDLATNVSHLAIHNDLNLMDGKMARFSFCIVKSKLFMTTNFPKRGTKLSQGPSSWISTHDYKSSKNNIAMNYIKFRLDNPHESQLKGN